MSTAVLERPTIADHIARVVAEAPTLTDETRERIISLFRAGGTK